MYRIFIVEDDAAIAEAVKKHIAGWGCEAGCAEDFSNVLHECLEFNPHLVLMDISLPFYNGYHWCGEIRKHSKVPIIFISSAADSMNILMALNMGGDDFIVKPFDLNVLTAKVQALLRRTYDFAAHVELIEHRGVCLNLADGTAAVKGERLELSPNEYRILQVLLENRGRTVRRDTLMERLWATDSFVDENTLTVNVTRLRRRLEAAGAEDLIRTVKGVGYIVD